MHFKLSPLGSVQVDIGAAATLEEVLDRCARISGSEIGAVIAVKNSKVIGLQHPVTSGDNIDVYPALSGG